VPVKEEPRSELKLGGFVMGAAYYDTNNNIVRPWLVKVNGEGDRSLDIDPLPTRLIAMASTRYKGLEGKGHVELDLKIGDAARIRQVFASFGADWGSVLVGQAYTLVGGWHFIDSYNMDAFFSQGGAWTRQPQVRYTRKIDELSVHVAVLTFRGMGTVVGIPASVGTAAVVDLPELPYLQARVERAVRGKGFIAAAGAVGQFEVSFTPAAASPLMAFKKKATAAMGAVDVVLPFGKHKLAAHAFYARSGGQSSAVQQAIAVEADGTLEPVASIGGFINGVIGLGGGMRLSVFAAIDNPIDHAGAINVPVERNLVGGALFAKELLPKLEAGLDVEYAETKSDPGAFHDIRTTVGLKYSL